MSCRRECANSWMAVLTVWSSLIPSFMAIRLSVRLKYPLAPLVIDSNSMGTVEVRRIASISNSYCSTSPVSWGTSSSGSGLPSVSDTSNTVTTLKAGRLMAILSMTGSPFSSRTGSLVDGSIFSRSTNVLVATGAGAKILIPCDPFLGWRSNFLSQVVYPATSEASGFCIAMRMELL